LASSIFVRIKRSGLQTDVAARVTSAFAARLHSSVSSSAFRSSIAYAVICMARSHDLLEGPDEEDDRDRKQRNGPRMRHHPPLNLRQEEADIGEVREPGASRHKIMSALPKTSAAHPTPLFGGGDARRSLGGT
jgi:hypothetical protein